MIRCFIVLNLLLANQIVAQDTVKNKAHLIIKTDIAMPVIGLATNYIAGSVTFEIYKGRHSFQVTGFASEIKRDGYRHNSVQIIPAYKFFLSKKKPAAGFYIGIYVKETEYYFTANKKYTAESYYLRYKRSSIGVGALFGYQNYIKKRLVFDVLIGIGARQVFDTKILQSENIYVEKMKTTFADGILALNIGYRF